MNRYFFEEYFKHSALNLGHVARDVRFFYTHPDADKLAKKGTFKHIGLSLIKRTKSFCNDGFYAIIPPHWHHTKEDLESIRKGSAIKWFLHGYAPWKYSNPCD